jgi:hypothetical protein
MEKVMAGIYSEGNEYRPESVCGKVMEEPEDFTRRLIVAGCTGNVTIA